MVSTGISVLPLHFNSAYRQNGLPRQGFGPVLVHDAASRAGWVGLASRGHATPKNAVCPIDSADTFPSPHLVIKILRAAYPAGTGSVTILCSMPAKQPPRQVALPQQQLVVAGMFNQTAPGFHQPLLQHRQSQLGRRYQLLTPQGYSVCLLFLKLFERVYAPLTAGLLGPVPGDRLYQRIVDDLDQLLSAVALKLAA